MPAGDQLRGLYIEIEVRGAEQAKKEIKELDDAVDSLDSSLGNVIGKLDKIGSGLGQVGGQMDDVELPDFDATKILDPETQATLNLNDLIELEGFGQVKIDKIRQAMQEGLVDVKESMGDADILGEKFFTPEETTLRPEVELDKSQLDPNISDIIDMESVPAQPGKFPYMMNYSGIEDLSRHPKTEEIDDRIVDVTEDTQKSSTAVKELSDEQSKLSKRFGNTAESIDITTKNLKKFAKVVGNSSSKTKDLIEAVTGLDLASTHVSMGPFIFQLKNAAAVMGSLIPTTAALAAAFIGLGTAAASAGSMIGAAFYGGMLGIGEELAKQSAKAKTAYEGVDLLWKKFYKKAEKAMEPLQGPMFQDFTLGVLRGALKLLRKFAETAAKTFKEIQPLLNAVSAEFWQNTPEFFSALHDAAVALAPEMASLAKIMANSIPGAIRYVTSIADEMWNEMVSLAAAIGNLIMGLIELGTVISQLTLPIITVLINVIAGAINVINMLPDVIIEGAAAAFLLSSALSTLGVSMGLTSAIMWAMTASSAQLWALLVRVAGASRVATVSTYLFNTSLSSLLSISTLTSISLKGLATSIKSVYASLGPLGIALIVLAGIFASFATNAYGVTGALDELIASLGWIVDIAEAVVNVLDAVFGAFFQMEGLEYLLFPIAVPLRLIIELLTILSYAIDGVIDAVTSLLDSLGPLGDMIAALGQTGLTAVIMGWVTAMYAQATAALVDAAANSTLASSFVGLITLQNSSTLSAYANAAANYVSATAKSIASGAVYALSWAYTTLTGSISLSTIATYANAAASYVAKTAKLVAMGVTYLLSAAYGVLTGAITAATIAEYAFLAPILIIVGIIAVAIGLIYAFTTNLWGFRDAVMGVVNGIWDFITGLISLINPMEILQGLIYALTHPLQAVKGLLEWFGNLGWLGKVLVSVFAPIIPIIWLTKKAVGFLADAFGSLAGKGSFLGGIIHALTNPLETLSGIIYALTHPIQTLQDAFNWFKNLDGLGTLLMSIFLPVIGPILAVTKAIGWLLDQFGLLQGTMKFLKGIINALLHPIQTLRGVLQWLANLNVVKIAVKIVKDVVGGITDFAEGIWNWLTPDVKKWRSKGKKMATTFISGIFSVNIGKMIGNWLASIIPFMPSSDAQRGPLSRLTEWGKAIPQTIASGILSAAGVLYSAIKTIMGKAENLWNKLTPNISMPDISMPEFDMPSIDMPSVSMPDISMPDMPSFDLPSLGELTPDISLPDMPSLGGIEKTWNKMTPDMSNIEKAWNKATPDMSGIMGWLSSAVNFVSGLTKRQMITPGPIANPEKSSTGITHKTNKINLNQTIENTFNEAEDPEQIRDEIERIKDDEAVKTIKTSLEKENST